MNNEYLICLNFGIIAVVCIFYFIYFIGHLTYANYYVILHNKFKETIGVSFFAFIVLNIMTIMMSSCSPKLSFLMNFTIISFMWYIFGLMLCAVLLIANLYMKTRNYFKHKRGFDK